MNKERKRSELIQTYYDYAVISLAYDYYTFQEMLAENYLKNSFTDYKDSIAVVEDCVTSLLEHQFSVEKGNVVNDIRKRNTRQMVCLTAYTDRLRVAEYVWNRQEFRFKIQPQTEDMSDFAV
ncbi:MAG: hypothetical protein ACI4CT_07685, partial [Lachnospiraceae bacterium]